MEVKHINSYYKPQDPTQRLGCKDLGCMMSDENKAEPRGGELLLKGTLAVRGQVYCCWETVWTLRSASVSEARWAVILSREERARPQRTRCGSVGACWMIDQEILFLGGHSSREGLPAGSARVGPRSEACRKQGCLHKSGILLRLVSGHRESHESLRREWDLGGWGSEPCTDNQGEYLSLTEPIWSRLDLPVSWFLTTGP